MRHREYKSYDAYVEHQKRGHHEARPTDAELQTEKTSELEKGWFRKWFGSLGPQIDLSKAKALCLGARFGEEVAVLRELGCDAIGLDLVANPPLVIEGDFHDIQLPEGTFDLVYSNALDHVLHLSSFVKESTRMLRPGGLLLYHIHMGQGCGGESFECLSIHRAEEITSMLGDFEILHDGDLVPNRAGLNYSILARKK